RVRSQHEGGPRLGYLQRVHGIRREGDLRQSHKPMSRHDVDVAIVGAGPVGVIAANLLGTYGVSALVLGRDRSPYSYPRAVGLYDDGLRAFQMVGLADKQFADMRLDVGLEIVSRSGCVLVRADTAGMDRPYGVPSAASMLQPLIEETLREGLSRFERVELRL